MMRRLEGGVPEGKEGGSSSGHESTVSSRGDEIKCPGYPGPAYLEGDEGFLVVNVDEHIFPRAEQTHIICGEESEMP